MSCLVLRWYERVPAGWHFPSRVVLRRVTIISLSQHLRDSSGVEDVGVDAFWYVLFLSSILLRRRLRVEDILIQLLVVYMLVTRLSRASVFW